MERRLRGSGRGNKWTVYEGTAKEEEIRVKTGGDERRLWDSGETDEHQRRRVWGQQKRRFGASRIRD